MSKRYNVYGIGNALVDVQYQVDDDYLQRMEVEKGGMTLVDEARQKALGDAVDGDPLQRTSGGSAANTMIMVSGFGGSSYYGCKVGTDEAGDFYLDGLSKAGVESNRQNRGEGVTGTCFVFITPDGERSMNTFLGITSTFGPEQVESAVIQDSDVVYIEGYLLSSEAGVEAALKAQQEAHGAGAKVALTLSDGFIIDVFRDPLEAVMKGGVDLLFSNESEAKAYADRDSVSTACSVLGKVVGDYVVTLGGEGAIVSDQGNVREVKGNAVDVVDTNGAGDAFAGAFLFGMTNGYTNEQAAKLANYAGAQVVSKLGARLDRGLAGEIEGILGEG
jgi:sugar/nucleoside kinase (ribokinase family)